MATNTHLDEADQYAVPVVAGVLSGQPVLIGAALPGVALFDRDEDGEATVKFNGSFNLSVVSAEAHAIGDIIYINAGTRVLSGTAAGNVRFGYYLQAVAGAGTATLPVKVGY